MSIWWWLAIVLACSVSATAIGAFLLRIGAQYDEEMDMSAEDRG